MNKTSRFEMRLHPDKLAAYKKHAANYRLSLSAWFELCADYAIRKEIERVEYEKSSCE
jgi:hypothetical protein